MNSPQSQSSIEVAKRAWLSSRPILGYRPHRGQKLTHLSRAPFKIITTGNRWGKSYRAVADGCMAIQQVHPLDDYWRKSSRELPFRWRYISEPEVLKGVVQPNIYSLFPAGAITTGRKDPTGFFETFIIHGFNPSGIEYWAEIEFKNNGSPVSTFAGTWYDKITIDEPCSELVYNENRARLSSTDEPLRIDINWTALDDANWADTAIYDSPDYNNPDKMFHYEGSTWDNCRCLSPEEHGIECRCHGGHIPKDKILEYENEIKRTNPLEYEARILGKRKGGSRAVFPILNREVHMIDPSKMIGWVNGRPELCTIYVSVDPHGGRPDFVQFWAIDIIGKQYCVAEYPSFVNGQFEGKYYEKIQGSQTSYEQLATIVINRCKAFGYPHKVNIGGMAIDPHYALQTPKDSTQTVVQGINRAIGQIDTSFPRFIIAEVTKDGQREIDAGVRDLNEQLFYDISKPIGKGNEPRIYWSQDCVNSWRAIQGFKRAKQSAVDGASIINSRYEEEVKHGFDATHYYRAMRPHYTRIVSDYERARREYDNAPPSSRVA